MTYRQTKIYPTPANSQRDINGESGVPLDRAEWCLAYWASLLKPLTAEERGSAHFIFTAAGPELWIAKLIPAEQIQQERLTMHDSWLQALLNAGKVPTLDEIREQLSRVQNHG